MKYAPKGFQEEAAAPDTIVEAALAAASRGNKACPQINGKLVMTSGLARCYSCTHIFNPRAKGARSDVLCPCCA